MDKTVKEALEYATSYGYRLYEVDIRCGLAHALLAADNVSASRDQAEYAEQVSRSMGYYWGNVEANKILSTLEASAQGL